MKHDDYPELRQLLGGYVNQEIDEEYGTIEAAIAAFVREAGRSPSEMLVSECRALLESHATDEELEAVLRRDLGLEVSLEDRHTRPRAFLKRAIAVVTIQYGG